MAEYWVYENWTHGRARAHQDDCPYCNGGAGTQAGSGDANGRWVGSFARRDRAVAEAVRLHPDGRACGHRDAGE